MTEDRRAKAIRIAAGVVADGVGHKVVGTGWETPEGVLDAVYVDGEGSVHAVIVREYVYGQAGPKIDQAEIETARKIAAWLYAGTHGGEHVFVDSVVVCWQHAGQHVSEWTRGIWRV